MKRTAYQKLKDKNKLLIHDIYSLMGEKGFESKSITETRWRMQIDTERQIWSGEPQKKI